MTPKEALDQLKGSLSHDGRILLIDVLNAARYSAYDAGFQQALKSYAWWKNGVEYVGTCGTTLKYALEHRKSDPIYYRPDRVDLLPDNPCLLPPEPE